MSCDDNCSFKMNVADKLDPAGATQLMFNGGWRAYRDSTADDKSDTSPDYGVRFSQWVSLTQDEYYYVEATLHQAWGPINIDVGMEIKASTVPADHPKLESMVQKISLGQTNIDYDTLEIRITGADQATFKLAMLKPNGEYF